MTLRLIASHLDLDPRDPLYWPVPTLRRLAILRVTNPIAYERRIFTMMVAP